MTLWDPSKEFGKTKKNPEKLEKLENFGNNLAVRTIPAQSLLTITNVENRIFGRCALKAWKDNLVENLEKFGNLNRAGIKSFVVLKDCLTVSKTCCRLLFGLKSLELLMAF